MGRRFLETCCAGAVLCLTLTGCGTTRTSDTARTGMEQLLISNAVDHVVDGVDFKPLAGKNVFVDDQYLECVDKKYVIGAIRHRAFRAGARMVAKPEEADLVLEVHAGAVGTDKSDSFLGMPAVAMPGPFPVQIPEIKLYSQSKQVGTAKIGMIAYDPKTRAAVGQGGLAMSRSDNNNWYVLGVGPFTSGRVPDEIAMSADDSLGDDLKQTLRAVNPFPAGGERREVALANEELAPVAPGQASASAEIADDATGETPYMADQRSLPGYAPTQSNIYPPPGYSPDNGYGAPARPNLAPAGAPDQFAPPSAMGPQ